MRPTGKEGFLYGVKFQNVLVGGADKKVPKAAGTRYSRKPLKTAASLTEILLLPAARR